MFSPPGHTTSTLRGAFGVTGVPEAPLVAPRPIDNREWQEDLAWRCYMTGQGDWETRGCPQPGMREYRTGCRDIVSLFSYREGEHDMTCWILAGELADGSVFHLRASDVHSDFDCGGGGVMLLAPDWDSLFDHASHSELLDFRDNMSRDTPAPLRQYLGRSNQEEALRARLKSAFARRRGGFLQPAPPPRPRLGGSSS